MEIDIFDMLLLFILAIALALIIGVNVMYVVDKRLSDIQINVPACPACPPCIVPNYQISKSQAKNNHFAQELTINQSSADQNKPEQEYVEGFNTIGKSNEDGDNEIFLGTHQTVLPMIVTQDSDKNNRKTLMLRQGYSTTGSDTPNTGDLITYPSSDDILRYQGPGCFQGIDTKNVRQVKIDEINATSCRPYTGDAIKEDSVNHMRVKFMVPSSNEPDRSVTQDIMIHVPRLYMGKDPYISGISYAGASIEIPADIDQIGSIPVNDFDGDPVPIGSFMNEG